MGEKQGGKVKVGKRMVGANTGSDDLGVSSANTTKGGGDVTIVTRRKKKAVKMK